MLILIRSRALATLLLAGMAILPQLVRADDAVVADDNSKTTPPGAETALGKQLQVLHRDVTSSAYHDVLKTMIRTDLEAEWLRVGTPDNYRTFLKRHGGKAKVMANPKLKAAYEQRVKIAADFLTLIHQAYADMDKQPPFDDKAVEELLEQASEKELSESAGDQVPVQVADSVAGSEHNWHRMRGPSGQGEVVETTFPLTWSDSENVTWKTDIPGAGNSSPVVWNDKIFITSASEDGSERWMICYARRDGKELWKKPVPQQKTADAEKLYWKNSYASSTAVTDGERVIAFFGNLGIACFDFAGELLWQTDLGPFTTMHGPGTTPVLHKETVYFIQDQTNNDSVFVALDKRTGDIKWKQPRPSGACWSSPVVLQIGNQDQLVYNGSHYVAGYDLESGEELWRFAGPTREAVPMIVVGGGMIFSTSGRNGPTFAIRPGGTGDLTETNLIWKKKQGGSHVPSPLYHDGILYVVSDTGILTALDAKTGDTLWLKRLRGRFSMSPLEADGKLILTNESGKTFVLQAGPEFQLLAENDLDAGILATPAILGGQIFFRTDQHLLCIGKRVTEVSNRP